MRFLPPLAACIIGIAAVSALKAQETRPAESRPAPPVQKDATHDEAKERLARAAKAQCDAPDAPEITSLEAKFDFVAYEYDARGKVQKKPGDIRQFWAMKKGADNKETFAYRRELKADVGDYGTSAIDFTDVCWKFDPKSTRQISPFVFCNREGLPLDYKNINNRVWKPLLRHLGLKVRRPYQCRHTAATLWLGAGENPEWIARQLGHATTEMLFRVYSRYVPNLTRRDGSAFERLLAANLGHTPNPIPVQGA